jgi:hypothetical protein
VSAQSDGLGSSLLPGRAHVAGWFAHAQDCQGKGGALPYSEASAMMAANARMTLIHEVTRPCGVEVIRTGLIAFPYREMNSDV